MKRKYPQLIAAALACAVTLTTAQAQQSPQSEVWSPNYSIMTAPSPYIRADRVDLNETPIQKAVYQAEFSTPTPSAFRPTSMGGRLWKRPGSGRAC